MHVHARGIGAGNLCARAERLALACACRAPGAENLYMHVQSRAPGAGMHVHTERLALNTFVPADYKRSRWNVAADLTFVLSQPRLAIWKALPGSHLF